MPFRPSTSHSTLGASFFDPVSPAVFPRHVLRYRNQPQAARIGLDALDDAGWIQHLGRFEPLPGSFAQPLALRYHGHQFRHYNPDLGDGRGFLFAQCHDLASGRLLDLGTKGSGRTPWSRGGDGRLTLKGGVREVLATSMLQALGVDTSKSLSLIETGEALQRGDEPSPARSAVLVRLNHSHIRIGSFQRLAYLGDAEALRRLLDYTIRTYMPDVWRDDEAERAIAFLAEVCRRVAGVGADWMLAGFVHGVLNTDNINVTGESFDYGPWRFLPSYRPDFTAAYFDTGGLYAYGRQPEALLWNLARLAECLLPLAAQPALEAALHGFGPAFQASAGGGDAAPARPRRERAGGGRRPGAGGLDGAGRQPGAVRALLLRLAWRRRAPGLAASGVCRGGVRAAAGAADRLPSARGRPPGASLLRRAGAVHDADRRGRGDLGADRRGRRLVRLPGQAGRHRRDVGRAGGSRRPLTFLS